MASQNIQTEMKNVGERLLWKIRQIPQADTIEIIAFSIILIFIGVVLLMAILACSYCCCMGKKHRAIRVVPKGCV
ncbi:small integral membrane protein 5 [Pelodytes ibericus]